MLSFFPRDVLDEIWDIFESVSEGYLNDTLSKLLKWFCSAEQNGHRSSAVNRVLAT